MLLLLVMVVVRLFWMWSSTETSFLNKSNMFLLVFYVDYGGVDVIVWILDRLLRWTSLV